MKNILYLGIDPPFETHSKFSYDKKNSHLVHFPIIKTIPTAKEECLDSFKDLLMATHIIFTSKTAVKLFFDRVVDFNLPFNKIKEKIYIVVGKATASILKTFGIEFFFIADNETAEGVIQLLKTLNLKNSFIFWPHSKRSRKNLIHFFLEENLCFRESILYDTIPYLPSILPDISQIDEIVFTSPSTVDAFLTFFSKLPTNKILTPIGPITKLKLDFFQNLL